MKFETMASKQHKINRIATYLKQVGVTAADIDDAMYPWKLMAGHHIFGRMFERLKALDKDQFNVFSKLRSEGKADEKPDEVLAFLHTLNTADPYLVAQRNLYIQVQRSGQVDDPDAFDLVLPGLVKPAEAAALEAPKKQPE
jgi:hypothetical protein